MPIILAQQAPIAPLVTAGAAAGEVALKNFPTLAQLYEHMADLRARGAAGGGGGGGYGGGGGIQVLPDSDRGALAQVESQANRDQRGAELGFSAGQDPVARHIAMQENFKLAQQQDAQGSLERREAALNAPAAERAAGGQPAGGGEEQTPPSITFDQNDQQDLNHQLQILSETTKLARENRIGDDDALALINPALARRDELLKKQRLAQEQADQQKFQSAVKQQAAGAAVEKLHTEAQVKGAYVLPSDIPGMPRRELKIKPKTGEVYDLNEHRAKLAFDVWKTQTDHRAEAAKQRADAAAQQKESSSLLTSVRHHNTAIDKEIADFESGKLLKKPDYASGEARSKEVQRRVKEERDILKSLGEDVSGGQQQRPPLKRTMTTAPPANDIQPIPNHVPGQGDQVVPIPNDDGKNRQFVPLNTAKGQMSALDQWLNEQANTIPAPTKRKTLNPPGPKSALQQAAEDNQAAGHGYLNSNMPMF